MSAILAHAQLHHLRAVLDLSRQSRLASRRDGDRVAGAPSDAPRARPTCSVTHRTLTCQVQKSAVLRRRTMRRSIDHARPSTSEPRPSPGAAWPAAGRGPRRARRRCSTRSASGGRARGPSSSPGPASGRAIVAQRVGELVERGLVTEGDVGPSTGGRPPRQLAFRADAGHVLVADLGATSIDVAVTTLDGRILGHHDEPARIEAGPEACLDRVDALFESLLRTTAGTARAGCGASASACPGPVEFETGRPISPPIMPGWDGYPIRERFAARYGAPVWVDNDVNVLALGEWRSASPPATTTSSWSRSGPASAPASSRDGHLHRGAQGSAGDVGHIQVVDDPVGRLPLRQHRLPRGARRRGGARRGRARPPRATAGAPRLRIALDQRGARDRRGRRAGGVVRRPGRASRCSRRRAGASARCSRASSTSSTRR